LVGRKFGGQLLKNILIATYILIILVLSANARAMSAGMTSQYDASSNVVSVQGLVRHDCDQILNPQIQQISSNESTVTLRVALFETQNCDSSRGQELAPFQVRFNASDLGLKSGRLYLVLFENHLHPADQRSLMIDLREMVTDNGFEKHQVRPGQVHFWAPSLK